MWKVVLTRRELPDASLLITQTSLYLDVIPAKAGIHFALVLKSKDGFPLARE